MIYRGGRTAGTEELGGAGMSTGSNDQTAVIERVVLDMDTAVMPKIPQQRTHVPRLTTATSVLEAVLDAGFDRAPSDENTDVLRIPPRLGAHRQRRARSAAKRRMQGAARQYGRSYYIPKRTLRFWALAWLGSVLAFGSGLFFVYLWICNVLGVL